MRIEFYQSSINSPMFKIRGEEREYTEVEARDIIVENEMNIAKMYRAADYICDFIKERGYISLEFANDICDKRCIEYRSELWDFIHGWYKTNREYYHLKPNLRIEK